MKIRVQLLSIVLLLLLSACSLLPQEKQRNPAPLFQQQEQMSYTYAAVQRGDVVQTQTATAVVTAMNQQELAFTEDDRELTACHVVLGQTVQEGQVLAELETEDLQYALTELQSRIVLKQLELDYCVQTNRIALERQELQLSRMSTQAQIDQQKQAIAALKREHSAREQLLATELEELKAQEADLSARLEGCTLRAGQDGTVIKIGADRRSFVVAPLADALLRISSNEAPAFPVGTLVTVEYDGQQVQSTILSPQQASLEDDGGVYLSPGELAGILSGSSRCTVHYISASAEDTLYLPSSAMRESEGRSCVYLIGEDGLITTRMVEVGVIGDGVTEILSGLDEGEQVILSR